jgi:hypothetical protein
LTTGVGTAITWLYQSREWNRQQAYLSQQRYLEEKKAIADEVTKAIAETVSASDDILSLYYWNTVDNSSSEVDNKRMENWEQTSLKWRTSLYTLPAKLRIYYRDKQIQLILGEIIKKRNRVGNDIENLLVEYQSNKQTALANEENKKDADETLKRINEIRKSLGELTSIMVAEIRIDGQQ